TADAWEAAERAKWNFPSSPSIYSRQGTLAEPRTVRGSAPRAGSRSERESPKSRQTRTQRDMARSVNRVGVQASACALAGSTGICIRSILEYVSIHHDGETAQPEG